jgi:hypothetical protein
MATLVDLVRQRRAEHEAAQLESPISDERRIWALMALTAKAEEGDGPAGNHPLFPRSKSDQNKNAQGNKSWLDRSNLRKLLGK